MPGDERAELQAGDDREAVVDPEQQHEERDRAEALDVDAARPAEDPVAATARRRRAAMPHTTDSAIAHTEIASVSHSPASRNWRFEAPLGRAGLKTYQPQL